MVASVPPLPTPRYFDDALWGVDTWPLLSAAYAGDINKVTRMLDEDPARIHSQFAYYEPLHYAVRGGHAAMVKLLLERGAHPLATGWGGRLGDDTPIAKATHRGRQDLVDMLQEAAGRLPAYAMIERPDSAERRLQYELALVCGRDERARIVETLAARPDLATPIALYEAVHHGQTALARYLIDAGADVNGHMPWACWFTPLMHCLRYSEPRWELAQLLVDRGVPVDSTNGLGMTALHIVVLQGTPEAAQWLLDRGAGVNAVEPEFGLTPRGWAAKYRRPEMMATLDR